MEGQLKHHMKNPAAVEDVAGSIQEGGTSQRSRNEIQQLSPNKKESSGTADSTLQSSIYSTAEEDPRDVQSVSNGLNESSKKSGQILSTDQLYDRIRHLEDILAGKEAALLAVTQELDAVREMSCIDASIGPLSSGFDVDFKASIAEYNRKLQEHASALRQRDEYINKLAESLKQSVLDREELKQEASQLTTQVHTLQTQLQAVKRQMQQPQTKFLDALKDKEAQLQKKTAELNLCKAQSSKEVQYLMSSLEELQQRAARSASASPPASKTKEESDLKHLTDLRLQYDSDKKLFTKHITEAQETEAFLRKQLSAAQKECENLNLELSTIKLAYETQMTVCRDQHELDQKLEEQQSLEEKLSLAHQKLQESTKQALELEKEVHVLRVQLKDKNEVCMKQGDKIQLLQSQTQEYATDIATCHQTLEQYKKRIDELQAKHSEDIVHMEANHRTEVMHFNQRISELQKVHDRQLHIMHQDFNRMKQRQMEELAMKQLSHENEVNTSKRDAERYRAELREKNKLLNIQEQQLEEERQWSRTYSQQVQELGEKLNEEEDKNEEYREKIESLEQQLKEIDQACTLHQPQIEFLHKQLMDERQKSTNILQQLEDVRKQLLLEQERCKAYGVSIEDANSKVREMQIKNSEIKTQALKLDQSSKLKMKADQQKINALQSEILSLKEQLCREQSQVESYRVETEVLNEKLKSLSFLRKDLENSQMLLEGERQTSTKCKIEIENLNRELILQKSKYEEDCGKLLSQIQESNISIKTLEENYKERVCSEGQLSDDDANKQSSLDRKQLQDSLTEYLSQVTSLEVKIEVLQEKNINLIKEREEAEAQLKIVKEHLKIAKEEFENSSSALRDELSKKDLEIQELRKMNNETSMQRSEIESYNLQVRELIASKHALEKELSVEKAKYGEEIKILKDQVVNLQEILKSSIQSSEGETTLQDVKFPVKDLSPSFAKAMLSARVSRISEAVAHWFKRCEDLEKVNLELKINVKELQAQLFEADSEVKCNRSPPQIQSIDTEKRWCTCEAIFSKERNTLKNSIEMLRKELVEKELHYEDKMKNVLRKSKNFTQTSDTIDSVANLINDFSCIAKEKVMLENDLRKVKLECEMYSFDNCRLAENSERANKLLEESWKEHITLASDLHKSLKENSVVRARLMRLETIYESIKEKSTAPIDLVWQLIEELSSAPIEKSHSQDITHKPGILEKIESVIKIITKMNSDCESLIVKLQKDEDKTVCGYLQSEALGLRRLQSLLLETQQTIVSKVGPALQLHVDLLTRQLADKQIAFQDICEAHYSLEAEMREMEKRFQQQEEHLQEELSKQKASVKLWKLRAQAAQVQSSASRIADDSQCENISHILEEMDSVHSQAMTLLHAEMERVATIRENKVRLEMSDKLHAAEKKFKQQFDEIEKRIKTESSVRALQVLHQQEIDAVRAECDLTRIKAIHKLQEQLPSFFTKPPEVSPNLSCSNLSLRFMKHHISTNYNKALQKVSSTLQNELGQQLSLFVDDLRKTCTLNDSELDILTHDADCLNNFENVVARAHEIGEKLLDMQTSGLQSILSICESNHNLMLEKVQEMSKEFNTHCGMKNQHDELMKAKEEHRLTIESMSAAHKAEVSRLRLLLTQQNVGETSEPNETALSVLHKELEEKHKKQMEELRTYFEQKCADFEKHYSEEVFSQHSRKLSDCSSASESELVSEMYYAGPGSSNCAVPSGPSHFCDLLGESSFKDIEEQTPTVDVEKLFLENREQLETLRLALESRHQGELEAQKELFEGKVEELLRNMNESHAAELKLQSSRMQEMKDEEVELNKKLLEAENEIKHLKQQLSSVHQRDSLSSGEQLECDKKGDVKQHDKQTQSQFEDELKRMADVLKRRDSESSAQIAALKIKLRQNQEDMSKLEKDMSNLRSKHESDVQSLISSNNEKNTKIKELNNEIQELSLCIEKCNLLKEKAEMECDRMKEECESQMQIKDKECESQINDLKSALNKERLVQIEEQKSIQEKINSSVEEKRTLLEAEYTEYLEFVKKCADETKVQLVSKHEDEVKQIIDKYEKELASFRSPSKSNSSQADGEPLIKSSFTNLLDSERYNKESSLQNCLQELLKLVESQVESQQEPFEKIVVKLCNEVDQYQQILHQDLEMKLESVQKDCEKRFQLQLVEARGDIVQALEKQIQLLLDDNTNVDDKPPELQQLEKKLASKYHEKLMNMQTEYEAKISELNAKHASQLSLARSKKQSKHAIITAEDLDKLYRERDCLRSVAATLRDVVAELVRYFVSWEDDFNNTLMDELVKLEAGRDDDILTVTHQDHDNSVMLNQSCDVSQRDSTASEDEMPIIVATPARGRRLSSCVKRVHFAPDVSGILSLIDDGSLFESVGLNCSMRDASLNFQEELDRCLARLRSDSAALYALSKPALPSVSSKQSCANLSNEESPSGDQSGKLSDALQTIARLQRENEGLQNELKILCEEQEKSFAELQATRQRLNSLEQEARHQAEVVAEGYGEGEQSMTCDFPSSPRATTVEELQNKARSLLLGTSNTEEVSGVLSPNSSQHLPHIVEELCRDWERLAEDSRHKHEDLQQQVEAVDKQLRATRAFMDEQAAEREQERDDYVEEIKRLHELVRDKDRDRSSHQLMNHESTREICMHLKHLGTSISVESLEGQLKESQAILQDKQEKLEKLSAEHKQAVEKIWTLRDIISDLECQVATKAEEAATVSAQNDALRQMVEQQGRTQLELAQEMEQLQLCTNDGRLVERISQLEEQLSKHQALAEQLGDPSFIEQMKIQLQDLTASLELHTRELECAYVNSTLPASPCLSSPSEDVSVRETIEAIRAAAEKDASQQSDSCLVLPFNEVSRVMDQWQRHARADDAVLKKIRELDMQVDDLQAEKEALVNRLQEQMHLSSSLQAKLEDHRRKADVKLTEATAEMQSQIEDLRSGISSYSENLEAREKQVESLRAALCRAENELRGRDVDIKNNAELERNIAAQLQSQISKLSADKNKLQALLSEKDDMHVSIPALVESMLLDKNADIDRLEQQVHHLTKQMELSSHYVVTPSTTVEFEYCESEKVRAHVALSPVMELRRSLPIPVINESTLGKSEPRPNDTPLSFIAHQTSLENNGEELHPGTDVSVKPIPLEDTLSEMQSTPQSQQNSNSQSASETLSSTTGTFDMSSLASCEKQVASLEQELEAKTKEIEDLTKKLNDNANLISEMHIKNKSLEECEKKLEGISILEEELAHLRERHETLKKLYDDRGLEVAQLTEQLNQVQANTFSVQEKDEEVLSVKPCQDVSELKAKESEIQRLRNEVCATQTILTSLQRKVQEAKQIARSPNRSSPENNQALRVVQNELEAAKLEIVELRELCQSIRSEMEGEYQLKQSEFEKILQREQQEKQSLMTTLDKLQQESSKKLLSRIESDLIEAKKSVLEKEKENNMMRTEMNQLNMECVALKNQLSTPIREATSLAHKLDSEKKFAEALKEELLLFKNRASSLEEKCKSLEDQVKNMQIMDKAEHSEGNKHLREISELKRRVDDSFLDRSLLQKQIEQLSHDNAVLKEENFEVCKELSDMKQLIIEMHGVNASRDKAQKSLVSKSTEISESKMQNNALSQELFSLRKALKNIHKSIHDTSGLAEEDRQTLFKLQRQFHRPDLTGAGDGPFNKLTLTEIDINEIPPENVPLKESESLEDLTGLVQHELHVSVQLDHSLLETIDPSSKNPSVPVIKQTPNGRGLSEKSLSTEVESRLTQEVIYAQERIHQLEDELSRMKDSFQLLNTQLEAERAQYYTLQQQDCDLIKEMRVKLSEALDDQNALRLQLQSEFKQKSSLADLKEAQGLVCTDANSTGHRPVNEKLQYYEESELTKLRLEKEAAEKQLRRLQEVEIQRSRRRAVTEEKHRRKIDQLQTLHAETQQECVMLRQELAAVNQKLHVAHDEFAKDRDTQLKNHAPFVERLKNMNTFLEEHIEENVRMAKQMEDLTEEHRKLRRRIAQLEGQLSEKRSNESFEVANARFAAEKAEWEAEQKMLLLALNEAKQKHMLCSDSDVEERVSHLFGRYLRMQSYRKALVWQKRYLLSVISGLNESKSLTSHYLANSIENNKVLKRNPLRRFRSVVMVMMAVHRMQFMVERWLRGKRIGCGVVVQQTVSHCAFSTSSIPQGHSSLFTATHIPTEEMRSGLSQSPPTLERPRQLRTQHLSSSQYPRLSTSSRGPSNSLSECVSNFNLVQQRFDALLLNPPK